MIRNITDKNITVKNIIDNDLCIGCGMCIAQNVGTGHKMLRNKFGFLVPNVTAETDLVDSCVSVCPFNPFPEDNVKTEFELGELFLKEAPHQHKHVGRYFNTYVGYSNKYRMTSSSGGIATYILTQLLTKKIVDGVVAVVQTERKRHYEYALITNPDELSKASKTKYYPVSLAEAMKQIRDFQGTVAITGVGCFIKAIRLFQYYNPEISNKIKFTVGIICGGVKSDFFTEFLAANAGADINLFHSPEFRVKNPNSTASDYSFRCFGDNNKEYSIYMAEVGDMWGTGYFKNNACDFCDDVTTELADISLGDAWLNPFNQDGKGNNVIVTRSKLANELIEEGISSNELSVNQLPFDQFLQSQSGSFRHRQLALGYRIKKRKQKKLLTPPKRFKDLNISFDNIVVQELRSKNRKKSLISWSKKPNIHAFNKDLRLLRLELRVATSFSHKIRRLKRK